MTLDTQSPSAAGSRRRHPLFYAGAAFGLIAVIVAVACLVFGRARHQEPALPATPPAAAATPEIQHYPTDQLSTLASYLPDVDEGRLRVAPPIDWYIAPRGENYVARFVFDRMRQSPLPRITVEARVADSPKLRDVTEEKLLEFMEEFVGSWDKDTPPAVHDSLLPLVLGDVPCVAYRMSKRFRLGNRVYPADREVLVTLRRGRLYTVSLDVYAGQLDDYRADAWGVVAGLQFPEPDATDQPPPAADKADTPPGEENQVGPGDAPAEAGKAVSPPPQPQ
jgi:hypothetical protein